MKPNSHDFNEDVKCVPTGPYLFVCSFPLLGEAVGRISTPERAMDGLEGNEAQLTPPNGQPVMEAAEAGGQPMEEAADTAEQEAGDAPVSAKHSP